MKRFIVLAAVLAATVAAAGYKIVVEDGTTGAVTPDANPTLVFGQPATLVSQTCSAGSCTRATPSAATEGLRLGGVTSYRITACAASGQTLSGAGNLRAWVYNENALLWMRNPGLDLAVTASATRCQVFPDFEVAAGADIYRVVYAADAVTVSGGSVLTVRHDGFCKGAC